MVVATINPINLRDQVVSPEMNAVRYLVVEIVGSLHTIRSFFRRPYYFEDRDLNLPQMQTMMELVKAYCNVNRSLYQ